jgi:hypothetical protein
MEMEKLNNIKLRKRRQISTPFAHRVHSLINKGGAFYSSKLVTTKPNEIRDLKLFKSNY